MFTCQAHAHANAHAHSITNRHEGYFVDLYVRVSNALAINMYRKLGYSVYRQVIGYYSGEEDAYVTLTPTPQLHYHLIEP